MLLHFGHIAPALRPKSVRGETPVSLAARLERRLGIDPGTYLAVARREAAARTGRRATNAEAVEFLALLLTERLGLRAGDLPTSTWNLAEAWMSCPKCGPVVEIHPSFASFACPLHRLWTGPVRVTRRALGDVVPPNLRPTVCVNRQVVAAIEEFSALSKRAPVASAACLGRARSVRAHSQGREPTPEDVAVASSMLRVISSADTLADVARADSHRSAYEALTDVAKEAVERDRQMGATRTEIVDQIWLFLRPAAAARRQAEHLEPRIDIFTSPLAEFEASRALSWSFSTAGWLQMARTRREDSAWWADRYVIGRQHADAHWRRWLLMCPEGHIQCADPTRVRERADDSTEFHCTICAGTRLVPGVTSLAARFPDLVHEWDDDRNEPLRANSVLPGSQRQIWWRCRNAHTWAATPASRTAKRSGCPFCAGNAIVRGVDDFASTHPHLATYWDPAVEQRSPSEVTARDNIDQIQLRCPVGHQFVRSPFRFASTPTCPFCAGRALVPGVNDLATVSPEVAEWWDDEGNHALTPQDVRPGSPAKAAWRCPKGHQFVQVIGYLTRRNAPSCPVCTGRKLLTGVNDVATKYPSIVDDWADDLNLFAPYETVPGAGKWWWRCPSGHLQCAAARDRDRSRGCTACPRAARIGERSRT